MRDKRERVESEKAARAAAREKKKQGTAKNLRLETSQRGRKLKLSAERKSRKSFTCRMVTVMKLWMRRRVIHRG